MYMWGLCQGGALVSSSTAVINQPDKGNSREPRLTGHGTGHPSVQRFTGYDTGHPSVQRFTGHDTGHPGVQVTVD